MFWNILFLVIFIIWTIIYVKNKKMILSLPYLLIIFITPFYNILDQKVLVKIFGCVSSAQPNMFHIDVNANDLRVVVYNTFAVLISLLGIFLSKKLDSKKAKVIYILTILLLNLLLAYKICQLYMWK